MPELTDEAKTQIELEVRRLFAADASSHRTHLETQLTHLKWTVGVLGVMLGVMFIFTGWRTAEEIQKSVGVAANEWRIKNALDSKVDETVQTRVSNAVKDQEASLKERLSKTVEDTFRSPKLQAQLDRAIADKIAQVTSRIDRTSNALPDAVSLQLSQIHARIEGLTIIATGAHGSGEFACGATRQASDSDSTVMYGLTDGTGCGILNQTFYKRLSLKIPPRTP